MKKITLFAIAFLAISFASCKKDRVCTCTDVDGTKLETTYFDARKKDARALCTAQNTQEKITSGGVSVTLDRITCELK